MRSSVGVNTSTSSSKWGGERERERVHSIHATTCVKFKLNWCCIFRFRCTLSIIHGCKWINYAVFNSTLCFLCVFCFVKTRALRSTFDCSPVCVICNAVVIALWQAIKLEAHHGKLEQWFTIQSINMLEIDNEIYSHFYSHFYSYSYSYAYSDSWNFLFHWERFEWKAALLNSTQLCVQ